MEHYVSRFLFPPSSLLLSGTLRSFTAYGIKFLKYLVGPLFLIYNDSIIFSRSAIHRKYILHFIPAVVVLLIFITISIQQMFFLVEPSPFTRDMLRVILDFSYFHILVYMIIIFKNLFLIYHIRELVRKEVIRILFAITISVSIIMVSFLVMAIFSIKALNSISNMLVGILFIVMVIIDKKYPDVLKWLNIEIRKVRYQRSLITGIDTRLLRERVYDLMTDEKLYLNEDLTLNGMAVHLSISAHQLSEFLNSDMNTTFNSFINSFRLADAKKALLSVEKPSVLSIAYSVGFNTKSAFYKALKKDIGMTPTEYRKKHLTF